MPIMELVEPQAAANTQRISVTVTRADGHKAHASGMFAAGAEPTATSSTPSAVAETSEDGPSPFELMDIRVGKIVEAWEHPDSEKLWCVQQRATTCKRCGRMA